MNQAEWEATVPQAIKDDVLWKMKVYRQSLFLSELAWKDSTKIIDTRDVRSRSLADQLYRAVGSISANIAEGYSRGSGKERAHFYEYALGSAREARDWYYQARYLVEEKVSNHRIDLLTGIIQLLLASLPDQRSKTLREDSVDYTIDNDA